MKRKLLKRIGASVLVLVMTVCTFAQYVAPAREVQAETETEPVYDTTVDLLKYSKETEQLSTASSEMWLGTTSAKVLPPTEIYYVSFHIKAEELQNGGFVQIRFYGKAGMAFLSLYNSQYYLSDGFENGNKYVQGNKGLAGDGVTITYSQGPDGISIWMNGVKEQTNLKPTSTETTYAPKVHIEKGDFTLKNIKVWTACEGPHYDENSHILMYSADAIDKTDANLNYPLTTSALPVNETTYVSFDIKAIITGASSGAIIKFYGKGTMASFTLRKNEYIVNYFDNVNGSSSYATGLEDGVRVTYAQGPDGITIWLDGKQILSNAKPNSKQSAIPVITPSSATVELTNVKIWSVKDEPQFDITGHALKFSDGEKNIASGKDYFLGTEPFSTEKTTYVSFFIKADNEDASGNVLIKFYGKGAMARLNLLKDKYALYGFAGGDVSINYDTRLADGVRVTYAQGPDGITIWLDGKKVQTNLIPVSTDGALKPGLATGMPVILNDVKVWMDRTVTFRGADLVLNDDIDVNFYVAVDGYMSESLVAKATMGDGSVKEIPKNDWKLDEAKRCYKFTCDVAAKEMAKEVNVAIYDGDNLVKDCSYSVKEYAETLLAAPEQYEKEIPLIKAMLNYGANAQVYFAKGEETGVLANAVLNEGDKDVSVVTVENVSAFVPTSQKNEKMSVAGASLILEAKTTLKVFLKLEDGVHAEDYTATCNGKQLQVTKSGDYTCVLVENIDAANLNTKYEITLTNNTDTFTFTYSPMTYTYNVLKSAKYGEPLKNLVRALYLYNTAAKTYSTPAQ